MLKRNDKMNMIVIFGTIILLGITVNLFSHWKGSSGILGKKQDVGKETGIKTEAKFKELDDRYSHSFLGLLLVFSIMMIMSAGFLVYNYNDPKNKNIVVYLSVWVVGSFIATVVSFIGVCKAAEISGSGIDTSTAKWKEMEDYFKKLLWWSTGMFAVLMILSVCCRAYVYKLKDDEGADNKESSILEPESQV